jgi:hypothetical protein
MAVAVSSDAVTGYHWGAHDGQCDSIFRFVSLLRARYTHGRAGPFEILNLATNEYCQVNDSIKCICERLGANPVRRHTGGERGWIGDDPLIVLEAQE